MYVTWTHFYLAFRMDGTVLVSYKPLGSFVRIILNFLFIFLFNFKFQIVE